MADNTNEVGIYYRAGGKLSHAGCEMLPNGKDIERIIIERIEFKDNETINGRNEQGVWLAHFAQNPYTKLPMVLNATNRKRIAKLFPQCNGYINLLKNVAVRLTREKCRDVQDGGETFGLRISKIPAAAAPVAPAPAPAVKKTLSADNIDKVVEWAKSKGKTIDDIKAAYVMPEEVENAIMDALNS